MTATIKSSNLRIALEAASATLAGALGIVTVFWHDWIEGLSGWDPDQHSGAYEWLIVAILLALAAVLGTAARRDSRLRAAAMRSYMKQQT